MIILKVLVSVISLLAGMGLADWLKETCPNNFPTIARSALAIVAVLASVSWIGLWF